MVLVPIHALHCHISGLVYCRQNGMLDAIGDLTALVCGHAGTKRPDVQESSDGSEVIGSQNFVFKVIGILNEAC